LHYARHAFSGLKSIKNFGPPTFSIGPSTLNALAPVLNHDKVSATKLGALSTQLPFTGTLSVISFSKRKENKNTGTVLITNIVGF